MCEAMSKMVLFVIPEGAVTGNGSNQVTSMLHHYFANFGMGETDAFLNADICVVQHRNQFVISYLSWRIVCGLHKKIVLHFLVVGHTKFSPDYGVGLFKKIFRCTPCATPDDVADCKALTCYIQLSLVLWMAKSKWCQCLIGRTRLQHLRQSQIWRNTTYFNFLAKIQALLHVASTQVQLLFHLQ